MGVQAKKHPLQVSRLRRSTQYGPTQWPTRWSLATLVNTRTTPIFPGITNFHHTFPTHETSDLLTQTSFLPVKPIPRCLISLSGIQSKHSLRHHRLKSWVSFKQKHDTTDQDTTFTLLERNLFIFSQPSWDSDGTPNQHIWYQLLGMMRFGFKICDSFCWKKPLIFPELVLLKVNILSQQVFEWVPLLGYLLFLCLWRKICSLNGTSPVLKVLFKFSDLLFLSDPSPMIGNACH